MIDLLNSFLETGHEMHPIWIISKGRAGDATTLDTLFADLGEDASKVYVFVSPAEYEDYKSHYPDFNIIPRDKQGTVGGARQEAWRVAYEEYGHKRAIFMDDDILRISPMVESATYTGKNAGSESSRMLNKEYWDEVPDRIRKTLHLFSYVGDRACDEVPNMMLGSAIKQHMSFGYKNHRTMYTINNGVTPKQMMFLELERMFDAGIQLDLKYFARHGDDIATVAEVLKAGGACFAVPSITYDFLPEAQNILRSQVRNAGNAAELHALEYEGLMTLPIKHYLKEKRSMIDGSYEWGEVNWVAYKKFIGEEGKLVRVPWSEDDPVDAPQRHIL